MVAREILLSFNALLHLVNLRCKEKSKDGIYRWLKQHFQPDCLIMFSCGREYFYDPLDSMFNDLDQNRDKIPHIDEIYKALLCYVNEAEGEDRVFWTTRKDKWVAVNNLIEQYSIPGPRFTGYSDMNLPDIEKALGPGFKCIYKVF